MTPTKDDLRAATALVAGHLSSAMAVLLIDVGHRVGLFAAMAGAGPLTPADLAARAGADERNVAEWLATMATARLVELDGSTERFELSPAMAAVLTGSGPENLARLARQPTTLAAVVPVVADAVREGVGVGYEAYAGFGAAMDTLSAPLYTCCALDYLACAPGLLERFRTQGGRSLDIGCGAGRFTLAVARELPLVEAVGIDLDAVAVGAALAMADDDGLAARFEVADALTLPTDSPWDLITAFDAIHDQADPAGVLARIHDALAPDGVFLMVDVRAESTVVDNLDHPMGPWLYGISTLHCLQVSLAGGGPGLGTCWGRQTARAMLADAGFDSVEEARVERDRANIVYVCRSERS